MTSPRISFRRAAEAEVAWAVREGRITREGTLICLRRHVPEWWHELAAAGCGPRIEHAPIPPSRDATCAPALRSLLGRVPTMQDPLTFFCKEGRHRSGILAAVLTHRNGGTLDEALQVYVRAAGARARPRELYLVRNLCSGS